ncbi:organic solute transporter Ostalpha-domain-containing protein [Cokeromyces recurvatus]|uniref:organic solute transporter Ostalpha-domain-containing protein n=1 Tax=Cokeromyces recurvatus TaxID=90255 RepID=UPI00221EE115|nr:organic solute transporter Ostalpha-domain-containing protein [Cokeromyces recurvatus]KAI7905750.1 organic solute transporter Ostalpha-domain-containing protein [Cokeromyces recurvatus]
MDEHCPTLGGLSENGFNPEFDLKQLVLNPSNSMHVWGWLTSGFLVLCTITIASHTINEHLHYYYTPNIQRHKVRVIAYPAAYSILAWLSYLKYDYETVILFFARLFESFAVYNLYMCLQAYLEPFRIKNEGIKESMKTKVLGVYTLNLKSKWGLHFRVITDVLVLQFPIWNILAALISIFTQIKGIYCDGQFSPHGAYVYLSIIQFISLSIILMALFTYLSVYNDEWKEGQIRAHGMFWCVKGPIMVIFYFGDILLAILSYFNIIKDKPAGTPGGTYWTAAAIKNGYYVLIICVCMTAVAILMQIYFGVDAKEYEHNLDEDGYFEALKDGFLAYIPQFLMKVFRCGEETVVLAKKRHRLNKKDKRRLQRTSEDNLLTVSTHLEEYPHDPSSRSIHHYASSQQQPTLLHLRDRKECMDQYDNSLSLPLENFTANIIHDKRQQSS